MDNAFNDSVYPAYTSEELRAFIAAGRGNARMEGELDRRAVVAAGDRARMTQGERLRSI